MSHKSYHNGFTVPAKSTKAIADLALEIRKVTGVIGAFPIVDFLEFASTKYEIRDLSFMESNLGLTQQDGTIILREDVYDGACEGIGFHRFTVAHEIGHAIMHKDHIGLAREYKKTDKVYKNSEWQANEFAGQLLVPENEIKLKSNFSTITAKEISNEYDVSYECAQTRLTKIRGY